MYMIADALLDIYNAPADYTMVVIEDVARDHWARAGKFLLDH